MSQVNIGLEVALLRSLCDEFTLKHIMEMDNTWRLLRLSGRRTGRLGNGRRLQNNTASRIQTNRISMLANDEPAPQEVGDTYNVDKAYIR